MAYSLNKLRISPTEFSDKFRVSVNKENIKIKNELDSLASTKLNVSSVDAAIDTKATVTGIAGTILPTTTSTFDLGSTTKKFRTLELSSNITAAGTLHTLGAFEISGSTIRSVNTNLLTINDNLTVVGTLNTGPVISTGQVSGTTGSFSSTVTGTQFNGAVQGNVVGSVKGDVKATDDTIMINSTTKQFGFANANVVGNLTGNVNATTVTTGIAIVGGSNIRSFSVAMGVALS